MTPKRMTLAAVLVLMVVFLSPIVYMAGHRASLWLATPAAEVEGGGAWPSLDEGERDPGNMGERLKPANGVAEI
jgi:hypothetical protein